MKLRIYEADDVGMGVLVVTVEDLRAWAKQKLKEDAECTWGLPTEPLLEELLASLSPSLPKKRSRKKSDKEQLIQEALNDNI